MSIGSFFTSLWKSISSFWTASTIGTAIDNAAAAAWKELETHGPQVLENVATAGTTAILAAMGASSPVSVIIAAGISAAEAAFRQQGAQVAATTLSTFTSALHTAVATTQASAEATAAKVGATVQFAALGPSADFAKLIPQFEALAAKLKADADNMRASQG